MKRTIASRVESFPSITLWKAMCEGGQQAWEEVKAEQKEDVEGKGESE